VHPPFPQVWKSPTPYLTSANLSPERSSCAVVRAASTKNNIYKLYHQVRDRISPVTVGYRQYSEKRKNRIKRPTVESHQTRQPHKFFRTRKGKLCKKEKHLQKANTRKTTSFGPCNANARRKKPEAPVCTPNAVILQFDNIGKMIVMLCADLSSM
jgi:hypothetical protein